MVSKLKKSNTQIEESAYPWAERFIEIATKVIRQVHFNYGSWAVGQNGININNHLNLNRAVGFELADERAVCAEIVQYCLNSALLSGTWVSKNKKKNIKSGLRFWKIDREIQYINSENYLDILMQRYSINNQTGEITYHKGAVYIEAKRARTQTIKITSKGTELTQKKKTAKTICKKDIKSLLDEKRYIKSNPRNLPFKEINTHLLVWGKYSKKQKLTPSKYLKEIKDELKDQKISCQIKIHQQRWIPLDFPKKKESAIANWGWIALFEVE